MGFASINFLKINGRDIQQNHILSVSDSQYSNSSNSSGAQSGNTGSGRSPTDVPTSFSLVSGVEKLCLATLDADGHCVEAQGSLRVLLEAM